MLAKAFSQFSKPSLSSQASAGLLGLMKRNAYTSATQPNVFVNKHTRVICQGMTGKHVSISFKSFQYANLYIGYLPYSVSNSLWNKDGWRSQQQKGWH